MTRPLLEDVGCVIMAYIRYARPNVESPFVFLTVNAPYTQMKPGSVGCILDRHRVRSGIQKRRGAAGGMLPLRHAPARRMLEQGTPLAAVADVMGHTGYASTAPYLKVNIEGLRGMRAFSWGGAYGCVMGQKLKRIHIHPSRLVPQELCGDSGFHQNLILLL